MDETPLSGIEAIEHRIRRNVGRMMFATRWVMAPIYLGLLAVLLGLAVKFVQKIVTIVPTLMGFDDNETILAALTLVDISLVANLVVIVIFAGWENFVGPLLRGPGERDTVWLEKLDFAAVKVKLFGSISAIATIQILETFVHIDRAAKQDTAWQLAILLGIGATGVMVAAMDRLGGGK